MSETKIFIAFMSSYLYGNCIQDVIFLLLALFVFLNEQAQLNPSISSSGLWRAKYRLKRTMQMFFINFSYFLAIGLPLISCAEYKGHIYNATTSERRALRYFVCFSCALARFVHDGMGKLVWTEPHPISIPIPGSFCCLSEDSKPRRRGDAGNEVTYLARHYTQLPCVFIFRVLI